MKNRHIITLIITALTVTTATPQITPQQIFKEALQVAREVDDYDYRAQALAVIARAMAEAGMYQQALQVAREIDDDNYRAWTLALEGIAWAMAEAGVREARLYLEALQVAREMDNAYLRAWTLAVIAGAMARAGFPVSNVLLEWRSVAGPCSGGGRACLVYSSGFSVPAGLGNLLLSFEASNVPGHRLFHIFLRSPSGKAYYACSNSSHVVIPVPSPEQGEWRVEVYAESRHGFVRGRGYVQVSPEVEYFVKAYTDPNVLVEALPVRHAETRERARAMALLMVRRIDGGDPLTVERGRSYVYEVTLVLPFASRAMDVTGKELFERFSRLFDRFPNRLSVAYSDDTGLLAKRNVYPDFLMLRDGRWVSLRTELGPDAKGFVERWTARWFVFFAAKAIPFLGTAVSVVEFLRDAVGLALEDRLYDAGIYTLALYTYLGLDENKLDIVDYDLAPLDGVTQYRLRVALSFTGDAELRVYVAGAMFTDELLSKPYYIEPTVVSYEVKVRE